MHERKTGEGFYLRKFPPLTGLIRRVDRNIEDLGLHEGSREALRSLGVKLTVENLTPEISQILTDCPCIVVGNHPTLTEPLALPASLPQREDAFLVMSQSFLGLLPHFKPHIVPIYLGYQKQGESILTSVVRKVLTHGGNIDYEEAHKRNIESIQLAASRISNGDLGIIFPAPFLPLRDGQWKTGLGYLIAVQYPAETYLVETLIEGTTSHDVLRVLPGSRYVYPDIKVTFSDPQKISDIKDKNPKATERELVAATERDYLNWVKSIRRRR